MPKFGTKSALFGYFWARILKNYCHIWDQHPQICQKWVFNSYSKFQCLRISVIAKFCEETKMPKFGTKNALFGYFWARTLKKNYCKIWHQHLQICLFAKSYEKTKVPKFGTKNAWFMYFWAGIWKQYCHIWNQHPRICLIAKFCGKTKMPKFGTKNALFGYFWARILKNYCHTWNQHP